MSSQILSARDFDGVKTTGRSLLAAVNQASASARNNWLFFLALLTYLIIAVAGVTHKDLLLNAPVNLPILEIPLALDRFFLFAPLVLLMVHFGILVQHVLLSRKVIELDRVLREDETWRGKYTHPLRLELHSYFFTQVLAGTKRSKVFGSFLHVMVWLSLVILPIFVILFFQIVFLPYHNAAVTWAHRIYLLIEIIILAGVGIFLRRPDANFWQAISKAGRYSRGNFYMTVIAEVIALFISFIILTIPDSWLDQKKIAISNSISAFGAKIVKDESYLSQNVLPHVRKVGSALPRWKFARNLIVTDENLVGGNEDSAHQRISLRHRNLRYAVLNRSIMTGFDFAGADLSGAQMIGVDISNGRFSCLTDGRQVSPTDHTSYLEDEGSEVCAILKGADLRRAKLLGTNFNRTNLINAKLEGANATKADFSNADLSGGDLSALKAQGARFSGSHLYFSSVLNAQVQGADFSGSQLVGADFTNANLTGSSFSFVKAYGASFEAVQAAGADFSYANLKGAKLEDGKFNGVSFDGASFWYTKPPKFTVDGQGHLASFANVEIAPLEQQQEQSLNGFVSQYGSGTDHKLVEQLLNNRKPAWRDDDASVWNKQITAFKAADQKQYKDDLTKKLAELVCDTPWGLDGQTQGIVSRAARGGFNGDVIGFYRAISTPHCNLVSKLDDPLRYRLVQALNTQLGQLKKTHIKQLDNTAPARQAPPIQSLDGNDDLLTGDVKNK